MFDYPNLLLVRWKKFSDSVYNSFEHFWKSKKYNNTTWLLLISVDNVIQKNNELKDSKSKLQTYINNLKASKCVLKENLLSLTISLKLARTKHKSS